MDRNHPGNYLTASQNRLLMESKHGDKDSAPKSRRDMRRPDKAGNVDPDIIQTPVESFGCCKNARRCRSYYAVLGDGLCEKCWDSTWKDLRKR